MSIDTTIEKCFQYAVGLSRKQCNCTDAGKPGDAAKSDADIFLDETEGLDLKMVDAASDCNEGNLWQIMAESREESIKQFVTDVTANVAATPGVRLRRNKFSGIVGNPLFSTNHRHNNSKAGLRIYCPDIISGMGYITEIGTCFDQTTNLTIKVYNNIDPTEIGTVLVATEANKLKWNKLGNPIPLPMHTPYPLNLEYFLLYDKGTLTAKNNNLFCGCGGAFQPTWNYKKPYCNSRDPKGDKYAWADYAMIVGTRGDVVQNRTTWTTEYEMNGLLLKIEFKCKADEIMCVDSIDYVSNPFAKVYAYTIRYKAAELLIEKIMKTSKISRYTLMEPERLWGKRNHFRKEYNDRVSVWLPNELSKPENINRISDCFMCEDALGFAKVGIIV